MAFSKALEDVARGCDTEEENLCAACKIDGEYRPSVKYCLDCNHPICQPCVDSHRRIKHIQSHKLVDSENTDVVKVAQILSTCVTCPKHDGRSIELICMDHDEFCCSTCATVNHRGCRQVKEVAAECQSSPVGADLQTLTQHLASAKSHIEKIVASYQANTALIQLQISQNIPKQIRDMRSIINKTFDDLEKRFEKETRSLGHLKLFECSSEVARWQSHISTINDNANLLSVAQQNGSEIHQYISVRNIHKSLAEVVNSISQTRQLTLENLSFSFDRDAFLKSNGIIINNERKSLAAIDPEGAVYEQMGTNINKDKWTQRQKLAFQRVQELNPRASSFANLSVERTTVPQPTYPHSQSYLHPRMPRGYYSFSHPQ